MTSWFGFLWLVFVCVVAAWALAAVVAAALAELPVARSSPPKVRARRGVLLALLPWLAPFITAGSIFVIAVAKPLGLIADHCLYHGPGHPHLCLEHLPAIALGQLHLLGIAIVLLAVLLLVGRYLVRERRMAARLQSMYSLAHGHGRLRILEDGQSIALAANPRTPFVLMSRGLLHRLSWRERRIVLAHEIAHLRRRDLLKSVLFELLLLMHLPRAARKLRGVWRQAVEERADDCVARRFGADSVAQALVRVARGSAVGSVQAFSAGGADTLRRIERLIAPAEAATGRPEFECFYIALLLAASAAVTTGHHALETLLGFLAGG